MKRTVYRSRDSFAQVNWDMVRECNGDIVLAVVFDWITWKADDKYDGVTDVHGHVWYPTSVSALARTMETSEKTVRRALAGLVELGHLDSTQLRLGGYGDRTLSYRPLWDEDVSSDKTAENVENPHDSAFAHTGESIRPDGQISFAHTGESTITNHLLTDVKELSLIGDEEVRSAPSIEDLFSVFWTAWPRKVDRKDAVHAFTKTLASSVFRGQSAEDIAAHLTERATAWAHQWTVVEGRPLTKIPHAATWLNHERWTDEIPSATASVAAPPLSRAAQAALLTREIMEGNQANDGSRDQRALDARSSR